MASKSKERIVVIFGPTAVGKTELICRIFSGKAEVISADSMQVYRGMDIGTAKPSKEVITRIPHHLIDIRDPEEQYDLGNFVRAARELVPEILARGKIPILSGGTAYYIKHFLQGLPGAPKADPRVREELKREAASRGIGALYDELNREDPVSVGRISPMDGYRIIRALEVFRMTGRPLSSFPSADRLPHGLKALVVGLYRSREELALRIDRRVDDMFEAGLIDEVKALLSQGYGRDTPGMRGIGYREFFLMREAGCMTFKDLKDLIKRNSRKYAKRQMTFFRSLPEVHWMPIEEAESFLMDWVSQK